MIPAYSEEVKIQITEKDAGLLTLEQQVSQLREQVRQLQETVEYMGREKMRLKSDLDTLKNLIQRG
jgi:predicted RNase H-like nuclease (RuvC/YqgF family)